MTITTRFRHAMLLAFVLFSSLTCLPGQLSAFNGGPPVAATTPRRHPNLSHEHVYRGHWRLYVTRNSFSAAISCQLRSKAHDAFFLKEAVGFRYAPNWEVGEAAYRIDGAGPRRMRDDLPDLIQSGAPVDRGPIGYTSQGIVWVPYAALTQAKAITIQPRPDKPPRVRYFDGLVELHDLAIAHGCVPESSFVE